MVTHILKNLLSKKNIITLSFFALAGAIWGWALYTGELAEYPLTAVGGLSLAVLGGLGLSLDSRNPMFILRVVGLGFVGTVTGFFLAGIGIYSLSIWSIQVLDFFQFPVFFAEFIELEGGLGITVYLFNFILAGIFIGLFFALGLKVKIWPVVWRSGIGFGLASLIAPIIGNLIGNLFNSTLLSYLITFIFISKTLGLMILWGAQKQRDVKNPS